MYLNENILKNIVNDGVKFGAKEASKFIAEDEFNLQDDLETKPAKREWKYIVGSFYVNPNGLSKDYALFVHDWVPSWQVRNYYKDSWRRKWNAPFLTSSNWTQFMVRGKRAIEDNFLKNV